MKKLSLTLTLTLSLIAYNAYAWGPMGHRIVAEVAYHYLSPEACREVDDILGVHGMVYWATWPDEIKSDGQIYPTSYDWHFQDITGGLTPAQLMQMRNNYPTHGGNLWTSLDQLLMQLPQHSETLTVNSVPMPYHDALVYLIHLTADELCPMHMAREEDKGGNDVKVQWKDDATNLHKTWDEKIIESRGFSYTEYAQMLVDTYGNEVDSIANLSEMDFVQYVYTTTQRIYDYQSEWDGNTHKYMWRWKTTCDRLLFMAGVRLANNIHNIR